MNRFERSINYDRSGMQLSYAQDQRNVPTYKQSLSRDAISNAGDTLATLHECSGLTETAESPTTQFFQAWKDTIERCGPFSHMFTIAFKQPYSDGEAVSFPVKRTFQK